jgi:hypothetical protein
LRGASPEKGGALIQRFQVATKRDQADTLAAIRAAGGEVLRQWWIINAALIQGPHTLEQELRELKGVLRVIGMCWPSLGAIGS